MIFPRYLALFQNNLFFIIFQLDDVLNDYYGDDYGSNETKWRNFWKKNEDTEQINDTLDDDDDAMMHPVPKGEEAKIYKPTTSVVWPLSLLMEFRKSQWMVYCTGLSFGVIRYLFVDRVCVRSVIWLQSTISSLSTNGGFLFSGLLIFYEKKVCNMSFKKSLNTSKGYYNSYLGYVPHKEMQL